MTFAELHGSMQDYEASFLDFRESSGFPAEWFAAPDHFAVKCADAVDYQATLQMIQNRYTVEAIYEETIDERRLAAVRFPRAITIFDIGRPTFGWLEIMEPRPGQERDKSFVEHTEFYFSESGLVLKAAELMGIERVKRQSNEGHNWVNVVIDDDGREIKFNDKTLAQIVEEGLAAGKIRQIA